MAPNDQANNAPLGSFTLIQSDCLDKGRVLNPAIVDAIAGREFKLVANLPYQIASPLMTTLLIDHPNCLGQFITIQREVADRLLAKTSTKAYGPLSIIVQAFAKVKKIAILKPGCFWPPPKIDSAMVSLLPFSSKGVADGEDEDSNSTVLVGSDSRRAFARFVTVLFMKRRKQLGTILGRDFRKWEQIPEGITPNLRSETLSVQKIVELHQIVGELDSNS